MAELIQDRILVKPDPEKTQTESGLEIPEYAQEIPPYGEVISVGPGSTQCKPGDRVLFSKTTVYPFTKDGQLFFILHEKDIHYIL